MFSKIIDTVFPENSQSRTFINHLFFETKVPEHLQQNVINISDAALSLMKCSLEQHFFSREADDYLTSEVGKNDLQDHLLTRLEHNRKHSIPWLDSVKSLKGARVLEIGCGTGASTVALAEQGAHVTAVDIDDAALLDAKTRCDIYGVSAEFHNMNVTEVAQAFANEHFDFIIFWACLEHMTHEERMIAMQSTWDMLPAGSFWCVTDTPNRLYFYDSHTSMLPFFLWLPDELAIKYAQFSARQKFKDSFDNSSVDPDALLRLARWGRGLSFHEFELTMQPLADLAIVSFQAGFRRNQNLVHYLKAKTSLNYRYESFFRKRYPQIHPGFFQPYLDLIIKK